MPHQQHNNRSKQGHEKNAVIWEAKNISPSTSIVQPEIIQVNMQVSYGNDAIIMCLYIHYEIISFNCILNSDWIKRVQEFRIFFSLPLQYLGCPCCFEMQTSHCSQTQLQWLSSSSSSTPSPARMSSCPTWHHSLKWSVSNPVDPSTY